MSLKLALMDYPLADLAWQPVTGARWGVGISIVHLAAALICLRVWSRQRTGAEQQASARHTTFWLVLAVIMFGMFANKLFDLQTWITVLGRSMARDGGWYRQRKVFQAIIVGLSLVSGMLGIGYSVSVFRHGGKLHGLAWVAVVCLLTLVLARLASYAPVDQILYGLPLAGNRVNAMLELTGSVAVVLIAWVASRSESSERS